MDFEDGVYIRLSITYHKIQCNYCHAVFTPIFCACLGQVVINHKYLFVNITLIFFSHEFQNEVNKHNFNSHLEYELFQPQMGKFT